MLVSVDPSAYASKSEYLARLSEETDEKGFDDIVVLAPVPELVTQASSITAPGCVVNIFAGIPVGNEAKLPLTNVYQRRVRYIGSSGSRINDLQTVLEKARTGRLDTNRSVGVIGGIAQALKAVESVAKGETPAKTILFPSVPDFPLTALEDLRAVDRGVADRLSNGTVWTREAEAHFLAFHVSRP